MVYDTEKRHEVAEKKPRDAHGHFIKKDANPADAVKTSFTTSSPNLPNNPNHPKKDASLEEPLVSFKVNNPFKKLLYWLNDIRKKQTTTFDFKIKIPLLALPIFLAVLGGAFQLFFNLGKNVEKQETAALPTPTPIIIVQPTATPAPVLVTRLGTIKATYQVAFLITPTTLITQTSPTESSQSLTPPTSQISPTPTPSRFVLVISTSQIIFIIPSSTVNLNNYLKQRVLVTGLFDKMENTLKISKTSDIEILP